MRVRTVYILMLLSLVLLLMPGCAISPKVAVNKAKARIAHSIFWDCIKRHRANVHVTVHSAKIRTEFCLDQAYGVVIK